MSSIAVVLEFLLGLRGRPGCLEWRLDVPDAVQVRRYPVGSELVDLSVDPSRPGAPRELVVTTASALELVVHLVASGQAYRLPPGTTRLAVQPPP